MLVKYYYTLNAKALCSLSICEWIRESICYHEFTLWCFGYLSKTVSFLTSMPTCFGWFKLAQEGPHLELPKKWLFICLSNLVYQWVCQLWRNCAWNRTFRLMIYKSRWLILGWCCALRRDIKCIAEKDQILQKKYRNWTSLRLSGLEAYR